MKRQKISNILGLAVIILFISILSGCGYRLGNMAVGGITKISINRIENKTGKSFIEEPIVANNLIQEFNRDGTVSVVNEDASEAIITISLVDYRQHFEVLNQNDVGEQFRLTLDADITITQKGSRSILYKSRLQGEAYYSTDLDQTEIERTATKDAIKDLTIEIVRATVEGGW